MIAPTPWRIQRDTPSGRVYIVDAAENTIAWVFNESIATAQRIVDAVNPRKGHDRFGRSWCVGTGTAPEPDAHGRRVSCPSCGRRVKTASFGVIRNHIAATPNVAGL